MKKVLVLGTGGTIASSVTKEGLAPTSSSPEVTEELENYRSRFRVDYEEILNLDSSNIQLEEWLIISRFIFEKIQHYDGVIVLHGTDTMAYTASMLSYMLQNLHIPVVLTGSQTPMGQALSDAPSNLATAFEAVEKNIIGVSLAFANKVMIGTRTVKVRTKGFNAFESVNAPCRAEVFAEGLEIYPYEIPYSLSASCELKDEICNDVFLLKLIPGTNPSMLRMLKTMNYKGVVIETFGAGGMHYIRRDLLSSIKELIESGIIVAVCSQCLYEPSNLSIYEVGRKLLDTGVIPTGDMTTEAIVTKLMWALGQTTDREKVAEIFATNYAGEIIE